MKEVLFGKVGEVSADAEGDAIGTSVVEAIGAFDDSGHIFFDRFNITFEGREQSGVEDEVLAVVAYNTVNQGEAVVRADFLVLAEGAGGRDFGVFKVAPVLEVFVVGSGNDFAVKLKAINGNVGGDFGSHND